MALASRKFLLDVEETMRIILEQEDTDGNFQICITDGGPKVLSLGTIASNGYRTSNVGAVYVSFNQPAKLSPALCYPSPLSSVR